MRLNRLVTAFCLYALTLFVGSPYAQTQSSPQSPVRDPQAVAILNAALNAAGGISAFLAIQDYTGTGNITYPQADNLQGSVTVRAKGLNQFRMDATLPTGIRSQAVDGSRIEIKTEDGNVSSVHSEASMAPSRVIFPHLLLATALNSSGFSLIYKGLVEQEGHTANDVQIRSVVPGMVDANGQYAEYHTIDVLIDTSTFQVVMTQELVPRHTLRAIRYSDYRTVEGMTVPFSISEEVSSLSTWQIQLNEISFNTGVEDMTFQM